VGVFAAGHVAVLPFPFSDLSKSKFRPALLLAEVGRGDWIACQMTSNPYADPIAVQIAAEAFSTGGLQRVSYARPGKLFTAHERIFVSTAGMLRSDTLAEVKGAVISILQ
jgi:mRNA interferase MazF